MATTPATIEGTVTAITKPRSRRTAVPAPEKGAASPALDTLTSGATRPTDAVVQMDTTALAPHPANPPHRFERGFEDLAEQIRTAGQIRTPLQVRPAAGGTYEVLSGTRRLAAARLLGMLMVPIVIHRNLDDAAALAWVLTDNLNRLDFTLSEQADLVQAQLDLGISEEAIAAAAGKKREWVKQRTRVAALKPDARAVINAAPDLDVLQATTIAPFADDPALVAELTAIAHTNPEHLDQAAHARSLKRAVAARQAKEVAEFEGMGYQILDAAPYDNPEIKPLYDLSATAGGHAITETEHEQCPGRAVIIKTEVLNADADGTPNFHLRYWHYCTTWKTAGHYNRHANSSAGATSGPKSEEEKAKIAHTKATNAAAVTAEIVRRQWIRTFFQTAIVPADAAAHLARILRLAPYRTAQSAMADELTGTNSRTPMTPTQAMKHLAALAVWHVESEMPKDYWRNTGSAALYAAHLAQLQTWGYDLAPHEQDLVDADKKRAAAAAKQAGR